ncbi:hypothetical protein [Hahella ganghwensis]|uniref:hypothetical protein n=1 Tax=Hahella ganghwensis TaxID=286420 RepID=UPI0012FA4E22|nr:hypothetical protein [Hahella ganghwensis]
MGVDELQSGLLKVHLAVIKPIQRLFVLTTLVGILISCVSLPQKQPPIDFVSAFQNQDIDFMLNALYYSEDVERYRDNFRAEFQKIYRYSGQISNCVPATHDDFLAMIIVSTYETVQLEQEYVYECEFSEIGKGVLVVKTTDLNNQEKVYSISVGAMAVEKSSEEVVNSVKQLAASLMDGDNPEKIYFLGDKHFIYMEREECLQGQGYFIRYRTLQRLEPQNDSLIEELQFLVQTHLSGNLLSCNAKEIQAFIKETYPSVGYDHPRIGSIYLRLDESRKLWVGN